ncbi:MAG: FG-GAP repeat protein, partial [Cyclobacteriaceae bacterium]|nr:FG-GAP repeat protein [Cyclobacteriaceae bacterium]
MNFGNKVAISGNSIIVSGREFNDEGTGRDKLYIFEKDPGDDWVSATESYVLTYPFSALSLSARFGEFDVIDNELVVLTYGNQSAKIEVYTKSAGVYSLTQTINTPNGFNGQRYTWKIAFSPGVILIASDQFEHQDRQIGGAFIYEKHLESYPTSPKVLKAVKEGTQNWSGFGAAIAMSNNTVFIKGFKENGNLYSQSFYVFEKPLEGWTDATLPIMFEAPGYFDSNGKLVANDNYLFSTGFNFLNIVGFKKSVGGWSSEAMRFVLNDESLAEKSSIGWQLKLEGSHLIVGCPSRVSVKGLGRELIVDYFSATQAWETTEVTQKLINHVSDINATDDFFGEVFSVYGDRLAISAIGDDKHGLNSGVVYLFDAKGERIEPDFKIHNPEESNSTGFGRSLAMGDSIIFIGAPFKDSLNADGTTAFFNIGAVYVYRLTTNGWEYSTQILAPKMRPQINFGRQVAWTPGYCAVTEFYSGSSESIGRVHIYKENVTTKQFLYLATLDPSVHLRSDFFGKSMVMNDSLMVIGTGNFAPNVSYRLSAYVFKKKEEWKNATEDARLYATDSGWSDRFGASVSLYDQYIVVGAPYSPGLDPRPIPRDYLITGAAYIFKQPAGGWKGQLTEIAKLTPEDPTEFGTFGTTVIIDHNDIFIGSPNRFDTYNLSSNLTNNDNSLIPGKVYHYKKPIGGEWETTNQALRQIQSFDPDIIDAYGASMFITDRYLYVGAMLDNTSAGYRTGSVQTMMQLPVIDSPSKVVCLDQSPFKLFGFPKNGNWTGSGIDPVTGIFNPAIAGVGIHTINYERSGCETSVQIEVLNNDLLISQRSSAVQVKCIGTSVPLVFESNADKYDYTWYFKESSDKKFVKTDSLKQSITAIKPGFYQVIVDRGVCPDHVEQFTIVDE